MSLAHKGKKFSEEYRRKICLAQKGRKLTPEKQARITEGQRKYWNEYFKTHERKKSLPKGYTLR